QATFFDSLQVIGSPLARATPLLSGPRQFGQSSARRPAAGNKAPTNAHAKRVMKSLGSTPWAMSTSLRAAARPAAGSDDQANLAREAPIINGLGSAAGANEFSRPKPVTVLRPRLSPGKRPLNSWKAQAQLFLLPVLVVKTHKGPALAVLRPH